jgi:hypothetical protein
MKLYGKQLWVSASAFLVIVSFFNSGGATPIFSQQDPHPIYTPLGIDNFYTPKIKKFFSLSLTPFYQHAAKARDKDGRKVPAGDINGEWYIFGMYYGMPTSVNTKVSALATQTTYDNMRLSAQSLKSLPGTSSGQKYSTPYNDLKWTTNHTDLAAFLAANPTTINPAKDGFFNLSNHVTYEKIGLRGQLDLRVCNGLGLRVKSGFADYRQSPSFNLNTDFDTDLKANDASAKSIYANFLTTQTSLKNQFADLDLSLDAIRKTLLEDTFAQAYLHIPIKLKDEKKETVVTVAPYFAFGIWMPSGNKRCLKQAFSLAGGNDGHTALEGDFALAFDFPDTIQVSAGAGIIYYSSKNVNGLHVPTHSFQQGFYPYKADVRRKPGITWYGNFSVMAPDFLPGLSGYFDFVYTQHEKDAITYRSSAFTTSDVTFIPSQLENESEWKSQQYNFGVDYRLTKALTLGGAFQSTLGGRRIYATTTILGTATLRF